MERHEQIISNARKHSLLGKLWETWLATRKGVCRNEENWYNFVSEDCFDLTKNLKNIEDDAVVWYLNHTKTTFS